MLHSIAANECPCAAQTCFTMNSNYSLFLFTKPHKVIHNLVWWNRSVQEVKVRMTDASLDELVPIVLSLIEAYHVSHSKVMEDFDVVFWASAEAAFVRRWSHECDEFSRNDPIEVAILHFFVILVLTGIKGSEVVPTKPNGMLKAL